MDQELLVIGYKFEDSDDVDCLDCIKRNAQRLGVTLADYVEQQYDPVRRIDLMPNTKCCFCGKRLS
jgi:hypothetical protein